MYSVVCRKVHECRFTLGQLQRSIQRARHRIDHERLELTPDLMDKLLLEREQNYQRGNDQMNDCDEHRQCSILVPFAPRQPLDTLKLGDIYLKSIDQNHRRFYEKFLGNENSERGDDDNARNIQQLYVSMPLACRRSPLGLSLSPRRTTFDITRLPPPLDRTS